VCSEEENDGEEDDEEEIGLQSRSQCGRSIDTRVQEPIALQAGGIKRFAAIDRCNKICFSNSISDTAAEPDVRHHESRIVRLSYQSISVMVVDKPCLAIAAVGSRGWCAMQSSK